MSQTEQKAMKDKAYLFGPFFGELSWEYFRFAPYAIYLKKKHPKTNIIVLTRRSRFDLYGQYASILIPLDLKNDKEENQDCFRIQGFDLSLADKITDVFRIKYKKKYSIVEHNVPGILPWRYNLKWQFPRNKMDYDFRPRGANGLLVYKHVPEKHIILCDEGYRYVSDKYRVVNMKKFHDAIFPSINNKKRTYVGCLIELIKRCKFVVSNLSSDVGKLSILLNTPLIYPHRVISNDLVHLMNPNNTPIIDCSTIKEGIEIYENNF